MYMSVEKETAEIPSASQAMMQPKEEIATSLAPCDVLMGRGAPVSEYDGNKKLRDIVIARQSDYVRSSKRQEKHEVAMEIVRAVEANGGRFLRKVEEDNGGKEDQEGNGGTTMKWLVVKNKGEIIGKVKQLLRDMGPEAREKRANRRRNRGVSPRESPASTKTTNTAVVAEKKRPPETIPTGATSVSLQGLRGTGVEAAGGLSQRNSLPSLRAMQLQQQQQQQQQLALGLPLHSSQDRLPGLNAELSQLQAALNPSVLDAQASFLGQQTSPVNQAPSLLAHLLGQHLQQQQQQQQQLHFNNSLAEAARLALYQQQQQPSLTDPVYRLLLQNQQQTQGGLSIHEQALFGSLLMRHRQQTQAANILQNQQQQQQQQQQQRQHLLAGLASARGGAQEEKGEAHGSQSLDREKQNKSKT